MSTTSISFLKQTIIDRISTTVTTVQDVAAYEKSSFDGYPAVTVAMSDNTNDYWSSAENQRQFTFIVRIFVQLSDKPQLEASTDDEKKLAEEIMERVVSEMLDTFDQFFTLDNNADYMKAVPSSWAYANVGNGWCRTAEIKLQVVKSFDVL